MTKSRFFVSAFATLFASALLATARPSYASDERSVHVGPSFGAGAPSGFDLGMTATFSKLIAFDFRVAHIPDIQLTSDAKMQRLAFEGGLRLFPTRGSFFVALGGGYAKINGSATENIGGGASFEEHVLARAEMDYGYVKPELGWLWRFQNGVFIGTRVGAEIPIVSSRPNVTLTADGMTMNVDSKQSATNATAFLGTHVIPSVTLIEIGFLL